ncbi:MAG: hypothetical protein KH415_16745 [Clostridium sp.]|nr:hypothetical protein [Clostridium sp.]
MKTLMLSEGNIIYNGRLVELYNAMKKIGNVTLISISDSSNDKIDSSHYVIKKRKSRFKKLIYMYESLKKAYITEFDILFIDNLEACTIGLLIMKFLKPSKVILDSRELYLKEEPKSWKMRILTFFERRVIKKADIHICANKYRAELMSRIYNLKKMPIVFENIRIINEVPEVDKQYSLQLEKNDVTRIISTGGLFLNRALPIVNAMSELGEGYELYILGRGSDFEINEMKKTINSLKLNNIFFIGPKKRSIMRYFIQKCDIGIVYYSGKNVNERLCASGKLYEYMQEDIPFVANKLIPLEDLCNEYGVGVCESSLAEAILKVKDNYKKYQMNVKKFMKKVDVDENNYKLSEDIKKRLQ